MAHLTLSLLGSLHVTLADAPLAGLESDKTRALLAYLAVESDSPHRRETLIGLLWADCPEATARHNLRQALFNLRRAIGDPAADPPFLFVTRTEIQFNPAGDFSLDVARFNALCSARDEPEADRAGRLEEAVALYRGEFLHDFFIADSAEFEEWSLVHREALHQRALAALAYLADYNEQRGDYGSARRYLVRQLELDPWREEAHRQLMRVLAGDGQTGAALVQYETCRRVLEDELGIVPSAETRELYEQIRSGSWKPTSSPNRAPSGAFSPGPTASSAGPSLIFNFPSPLSPFIGRERELGELGRLVLDPACRFISLVGLGGIGKTRLALQTAIAHHDAFAEGVAFVPLSAVNSVSEIVPAIAAALSVTSHSAGDAKTVLLRYLWQARMLLILDNLEHLLTPESMRADVAGLFLEILQHAPQLKLLITSREQLNLQAEWVYEVKGLALPTEDARDVEDYDAVALFIQRARRAQASFRLADADRATVVRLCQLVDGMPLALELVAAWVTTLSLAEIVREIERNLDFPSAAWQDLPERHRSIRAVFDHSWRMLTAAEQTTLARLAIFHGGFHRRAAEQVARASLPLLASLVAKSLVRRQGMGGAAPFGRYEMHALVRRFAEEKLIERGECDAVCREHFLYFLRLAEKAELQLNGTEEVAWLDRLEQEQHNLRAALERSLTPDTAHDEAWIVESLRLAGALVPFWKARDHWGEGRAWLERVLSRAALVPASQAKAKALNGAVLLAIEQADTSTARSLAQQGLALAYELGDSPSIARARSLNGYLLWKQKRFTEARAESSQALALFQQIGDRTGMAYALHDLGHIAINQYDCAAAAEYLAASASIYREIGNSLGFNSTTGDLGLVAYLQGANAKAQALLEQALSGARAVGSIATSVASMNRLGDLARLRGDYETAGRLYAECIELYRRMGDKDEYPSLLHNLAYVELHRGDHNKALALFREALGMQRETANQAGIAECLEGIAAVLIETDRPEEGARLLGAAEAIREQCSVTLWPANQIEHDATSARLASTLDAVAVQAHWAEGRSRSAELALSDDIP